MVLLVDSRATNRSPAYRDPPAQDAAGVLQLMGLQVASLLCATSIRRDLTPRWDAWCAGFAEADGGAMDRDDSVSEHGARVERSTRLAGGLLLIGAVLTFYLTDLLFSRSPRVELFEGYDLAARVLAPAGAMLVAASLAVRALTRPFSRPTPRAQLLIGIALLAVGLAHMAYGPQILAATSDVLGATANAGIFIAELLARVVGLTALPLGIALLATQPLVRLAQTRHAHFLPAGPPDIEALD